jgi:acetyl-CoA acyltransferase
VKEAYIIDGIRTPIGNLRGSLSSVRADDLAALVLSELLGRNPQIDAGEIYEVILGCANQAGEDNRNIARMATLLAGLPYSVPAETVNRLCASGLSAAVHAARMIQTGEADLVISGGIEHMTRAPLVMGKSPLPFGGNPEVYDSTFGWRFINPKMKDMYGVEAMGETAENLAEREGISREDQDQFALWSQEKTKIAQENGRLALEIMPVDLPQKDGSVVRFQKDEFAKNFSTFEGLQGLKPAFRKGGSVTAGNASGLNDGAAALLLASEEGINKHQLSPLAKVISSGVSGVEPRFMGIGPVQASEIALKRAGLSLNQMDVIEINEAFAAQVLACTRKLGLDDKDPRINPNGGAIALGHPLGMSGARILYSAALELRERDKKYALVTMCVGLGQGYAVVIERV